MKFNIFKSLFPYDKEKDEKALKIAEIERQVDILIENQNYELLTSFVENGYELNIKQTKRFFLSLLVIEEDKVNVRQGFNHDAWANVIKEVGKYDKKFLNTTIHYMTNILKDTDYIQTLCPNRYTNVLKTWTVPNTVPEMKWCSTFFRLFKNEISESSSVNDLEKMKKNLQNIQISRKEGNKELYHNLHSNLTGEIINILNQKMTNLHEATLEDVKSIYGSKKVLSPSSEHDEIVQVVQNNNDFPNQSKQLLHEVYHLINGINKTLLDETQLLEFENLVNEKLPQMIKNYLDVQASLRDKVISNESANSILEDNLIKFKNLFSRMKETQNEVDLTHKLNNLRVHNQYLKSKI